MTQEERLEMQLEAIVHSVRHRIKSLEVEIRKDSNRIQSVLRDTNHRIASGGSLNTFGVLQDLGIGLGIGLEKKIYLLEELKNILEENGGC